MSIQTHQFTNGFRIIYEKPTNPLSITAAYVFNTFGSVSEPDKLHGAAHLIEHMCFKGTKKIPLAKDIFEEYDKIGAEFNAFTTKEYTCYTMKCQDDYLHHSIDILSDMMINSQFKKKEFIKEHNVVIEENNNDVNNDEDLIFVALDRLLYNGTSFDRPVDELAYHSKDNLNYDDVISLYHSYYQPHNMLISIVSNISFDQIKKMIQTTFFIKSHVNVSKCNVNNQLYINYQSIPQTDILYNIQHKPGITSSLITIGFRTCDRYSADKYTFEMLRQIIGVTMGGRLFTILREKKALVYTAVVYTNYYKHAGDFIFFTKTESQNMIRVGKKLGVLPSIIQIINDLIRDGITQEELTIAKGSILGQSMINLESNITQTLYNGEELLLGDNATKVVPYAKLYESYYKNITKQNIHDAIRKYFCKKNMCVCILGEKLPKNAVIHNVCEQIIQ